MSRLNRIASAFGLAPKPPGDVRRIAVALANFPPPDFSRVDLQRRWSVNEDTVRKILNDYEVQYVLTGASLLPFFTILQIEGMQDPWTVWLGADEETRRALQSDLLRPSEFHANNPKYASKHVNTVYRHIRENRIRAIRIGDQYRFAVQQSYAVLWGTGR